MNSRSHQQGFTIVELLVVVVIIGILVTITSIVFSGISDQADRTAVISESSQISHNLAANFAIDNKYPVDPSQTGNKVGGGRTFDYVLSTDRKQYCASVSSGKYTYRTSTSNAIPEEGSCWAVSTFAGSGVIGTADGTGTAAQFNRAQGLVVDSAGNLFITDWQNRCIRKATPSGVVTTFAGLCGTNGTADGTGTAARFSNVIGITIAPNNNLYVADATSPKIRMITPSAVVTTIAGSGFEGSTNATGTSASFDQPYDVALDSAGNLYVADHTNNHRIRKISTVGAVTTLAGSTQGYLDGTGIGAQFAGVVSLTVDPSGNILVSDRFNGRIRKITPAGVVTTLTNEPDVYAITMDANGNIYTTNDGTNARIRKISPSGTVGVVAGSQPGYTDGDGAIAKFSQPRDIALDANGNIYVADMGNNRIRKLTPRY